MAIGFLWPLFFLLTFALLVPYWGFILLNRDGKKTKNILLFLLPISIAFLSIVYKFPAFPQPVSLIIQPAKNSGNSWDEKEISVNEIQKFSLPSGTKEVIQLYDLHFDGDWRLTNNSLTYFPRQFFDGEISYNVDFFQGYLSIELQTGPDQGVVDISINGQQSIVDLYNPSEDKVYKIVRNPNIWENADRNRKILLSLLVFTDFLVYPFLFSIFLLGIILLFTSKQITHRGLGTFLLTIIVSLAFLFTGNFFRQEIVFPDDGLEEAVRLAIKHPDGPIYSNMVTSIVELEADGKEISRVDGIEFLTNLRALSLQDNLIVDITPIGRLEKLTELNLRGNQIRDIGPLRNLSTLQRLNLRENRIQEISNISNLKNLTYLNLHSNYDIADISPISNLQNIEVLILRNIPIKDQLSTLLDLRNLHQLNIRNCSISDISILEEFFERGILQDDGNSGKNAYLDIQENPIQNNGNDPYKVLRPYWQGIKYRYPLQLPYYPSPIQGPFFSETSGFFSNAFELEISTNYPKGLVFYTLDGSEPSINAQLQPLGSTYSYQSPILIQNLANQTNALPNYVSTTRFGDSTPPNEIFRANIVRAVVVVENGDRSNPVTQTYFVDTNMINRYTMPVVSLVSEPDGLFDPILGIYAGEESSNDDIQEDSIEEMANYDQRGMKWERPASFQLFSKEGDLLIDQNVGVRIHGNEFTRPYPQKSLLISANSQYDSQSIFQYDFFPELNYRFNQKKVNTYCDLILRNGGNNWNGLTIIDSLSQSLLAQTHLDYQGSQPVIVFLNGEYWGIYNLQTKYDEQYFESYYGIDPDEITLLENETIVKIGDPDDARQYDRILRFIDSKYDENAYATSTTLSNDKSYQYVSTLMDIENYIDYMVIELYFGNRDWLSNNVYQWRMEKEEASESATDLYGHDGKWRWMIADLDMGFLDASYNSIYYVFHDDGIEYKDHPSATFLIRSLLENPNFSTGLIRRFADQLNTTFKEEVVIAKIKEYQDIYAPEVEENIKRWGNMYGSVDRWNSSFDSLLLFAEQRPTFLRQYLVENFNLQGTVKVVFYSNDQQGYIRINDINIREGTIGVENPEEWSGIFFQGVPNQLSAVAYPGYRFSHWEGLNLPDPTSSSITITPDADLSITAVFTPIE